MNFTLEQPTTAEVRNYSRSEGSALRRCLHSFGTTKDPKGGPKMYFFSFSKVICQLKGESWKVS